jgi:hypothetical protein
MQMVSPVFPRLVLMGQLSGRKKPLPTYVVRDRLDP